MVLKGGRQDWDGWTQVAMVMIFELYCNNQKPVIVTADQVVYVTICVY